MSIGKNIAKFRKEKSLTQTDLGDILGVSNQAVSKWESEINMPDVMLLPEIAKALGVTLNQLYDIPDEVSKVEEVNLQPHYDLVAHLPWEDDGVIRGVVFEGRKMLTANEGLTQGFSFEIHGNPKDVYTECNLTVYGSVMGGANCADLTVAGSMSGGVCCNDLRVDGNLDGGVNCNDLFVGGSLNGSLCANDVSVRGDVHADGLSANSISCRGVYSDVVCGDMDTEKDDD